MGKKKSSAKTTEKTKRVSLGPQHRNMYCYDPDELVLIRKFHADILVSENPRKDASALAVMPKGLKGADLCNCAQRLRFLFERTGLDPGEVFNFKTRKAGGVETVMDTGWTPGDHEDLVVEEKDEMRKDDEEARADSDDGLPDWDNMH
jgi:hypothetical protein